MRSCLIVVLCLGLFSACGRETCVESQPISLTLASVTSSMVRVNVQLTHAGWFNVSLMERNNSAQISWTNTAQGLVAFGQLQSGTSYLVHGITFDRFEHQTGEDWLAFTTSKAQ